MIGILGGTFDPVHFGHLNPARELLNVHGFQQIRFMPASVPPHRDRPSASSQQRLEMVRLAIAGEPRFDVELCELERPGPSYMVDSLREIRAGMDGDTPLVLIMGVDAFAGLPGWHCWQSLTDDAHLLVTSRPGYTRSFEPVLSDWLAEREMQAIDQMRSTASGGVLFMELALVDVSATEIRERVRAGRDIEGLVPDAVRDYILKEGLYLAPNVRTE